MAHNLENGVANALLKESAAELSFRRRIIDLIPAIMKLPVPGYLKVFVIVLLFLCISMSFVLVMFLVNVALSLAAKGQSVNTPMFASLLGGHTLAGVGLGIPVTIRMADLENSNQLEAELKGVRRARQNKGKGQGGNPTSN
jgi:hypothetical protein